MKLSVVSQLWFVVESTGILFLDYVIARDFPDRSGRELFFRDANEPDGRAL
jgi:hypothetical protein